MSSDGRVGPVAANRSDLVRGSVGTESGEAATLSVVDAVVGKCHRVRRVGESKEARPQLSEALHTFEAAQVVTQRKRCC